MSSPLDAAEILDREFLGLRAKLLEVGAALDRLERAEGDVAGDPRLAKIRQAIALLAGEGPAADDGDRAERIQLLFSRAYDEGWRQSLAPARRED